jgi:hypothetical protein
MLRYQTAQIMGNHAAMAKFTAAISLVFPDAVNHPNVQIIQINATGRSVISRFTLKAPRSCSISNGTT